jgi:hypothetical protein
MIYLTLPFDLPMTLSPLLAAVLGKLGYWIYLAVWYTTGLTVIVDTHALFAVLVGAVVVTAVVLIVKDVRDLCRRTAC